MIDINEIQDTISQLENGSTSFANCDKLATLYIVADHFKKAYSDEPNEMEVKTVKEYKDIMPAYTEYCEIKRHYRMGKATAEAVKDSLTKVVKEIVEYISTIYSSTDMEEERTELKKLQEKISKLY